MHFADRRFLPLTRKPLSTLKLLERHDIQPMIRESADIFFTEMGEPLKLIGEEIKPSDIVQDRFDLLAIDNDGTAVTIELKRSINSFISCSAGPRGYDSEGEPGRFTEEYETTQKITDQEKLTDYLEAFWKKEILRQSIVAREYY